MSDKDGLISVDDMTEEELKGFSPEELDAWRRDDETDDGDQKETDEEAENKQIEDESAEESEESEVADEAEEPADEPASDETAPDTGEVDAAEIAVAAGAEAPQDDAPDPAVASAQEVSAARAFEFEAPKEAIDAIDSHKTAMKELIADYSDGEITVADYETKRLEIIDQINEISVGINNARMDARQDYQTAEAKVARDTAQWQMEINQFFAENQDIQQSTVKFAGMDALVKQLATDKGWATKPGPEILREAKRRLDKEFGEPIPAKPKKRAQKNIPVTLGNAPAAGENPTSNDSQFSFLDDLSEEDFEKAYIKFTPAEMKQYRSEA